MLFLTSLLISCSVDSDTGPSYVPVIPQKKVDYSNLIKDFYATGKDGSIELTWAPVSSKYQVFILDGTEETNSKNFVEQSLSEIKMENGTKKYSFSGLKNSTVEERILMNSKKGHTPVYTYSLIIKNKEGKELARDTAQATPAQTDFEYSTSESGISTVGNVWLILLDADSFVPKMANVEGYTRMKGYSSTKTTSIAAIKKCSGYNQYPVFYNNPEAVTKLIQDAGNLDTINEYFSTYLLKGEEIRWFTFIPSGAHGELYGKVVKTAVENSEYTEIEDVLELETALELKAYDKALRNGTKIRTKGYYEKDDGGAALYTVANRSAYTYGSLETALNQSCNIVVEDNFLNIRALGAGHCTQITKANYSEWEAYETAKYFYKGENLAEYRATHTGWEKFDHNDDALRWTEGKKILVNSRSSENQTVTLYAPKGNYRCASGISMDEDNFVFKGETTRRDITPDMQEAFESNYAIGNEGGSSNSGNEGTYFYSDNGSHFWWYHDFSSGVFGASNVRMEGITIEARETDSKRTFWHNTGDTAPYFTGVTYRSDSSKTNEPTQADQLWYSRQFQVSQSSNVTVKNCEFIITNHVRDEAVYEESGSEWLDVSAKTSERRAANPYVETTDLHTDKQFTTVTLYADWHDVTIDDCLIYNNSGVYRGSAIGFLDFYCNGCSNGTLKNSTLFCNVHDEMIGIFTKSWDFYPERKDRGIKNVNITGNKIYPTRDEHVDYIKPRIMVFTVGYDVSPNIYDVYIKNNYIWTDCLNSKLFTFGGFDDIGRGETVVKGNSIVIENHGGSYLFETRPNITIEDNNITLKSESGTISQNGMFFFKKTDKRDLYIKNNNIDIQCNYKGGGLVTPNDDKPGAVITGNNIHITGNLETPLFKNNREIRNNKILIDGECSNIISYSGTKIEQDITISGNTFTYKRDDHQDDYSWGNNQTEESKYGNGKNSPTFLNIYNISTENKFIVSGNIIKAPNATRQNKHLLRYYNSTPNVIITGNKLSKFSYLRLVSESIKDRFTFLNNTGTYGKTLSFSDCCLPDVTADSEPGKYEYNSVSKSYKLVNWNGKTEFPEYYDDGDHGKHPVSIIGSESCTGNPSYHSAKFKLPAQLKTIEKEAFMESSAPGISFPDTLKEIGERAFYNCGSIGSKEWGKIHNITVQTYTIVIPASVTKIGSQAFGQTGSSNLLIKCEAETKPENWADDWYSGTNTDIEWGYKK